MTSTITPSDIKSHTSWQAVINCYLKYHKVMNTKLSALNLTAAQHDILMNINHKPGCSQQQISNDLSVVKSNTSALIKKMISNNLIKRKKNPTDGRFFQLYLSSKGQKKLNESMLIQIEIIRTMTSALNESDFEKNLSTMNTLFQAIEKIPTI